MKISQLLNPVHSAPPSPEVVHGPWYTGSLPVTPPRRHTPTPVAAPGAPRPAHPRYPRGSPTPEPGWARAPLDVFARPALQAQRTAGMGSGASRHEPAAGLAQPRRPSLSPELVEVVLRDGRRTVLRQTLLAAGSACALGQLRWPAQAVQLDVAAATFDELAIFWRDGALPDGLDGAALDALAQAARRLQLPALELDLSLYAARQHAYGCIDARERVHAMFCLGNAQYAAGAAEAAEASWQEALNCQAPSRVRAQLAEAFAAQPTPDAQDGEAQGLAAINEALLAAELGEARSCIAPLERALLTCPELEVAHLMLGAALYWLGDDARATQHFARLWHAWAQQDAEDERDTTPSSQAWAMSASPQAPWSPRAPSDAEAAAGHDGRASSGDAADPGEHADAWLADYAAMFEGHFFVHLALAAGRLRRGLAEAAEAPLTRAMQLVPQHAGGHALCALHQHLVGAPRGGEPDAGHRLARTHHLRQLRAQGHFIGDELERFAAALGRPGLQRASLALA